MQLQQSKEQDKSWKTIPCLQKTNWLIQWLEIQNAVGPPTPLQTSTVWTWTHFSSCRPSLVFLLHAHTPPPGPEKLWPPHATEVLSPRSQRAGWLAATPTWTCGEMFFIWFHSVVSVHSWRQEPKAWLHCIALFFSQLNLKQNQKLTFLGGSEGNKIGVVINPTDLMITSKFVY